ncbi:MAG: hypothetical protein ACK5Z5_06095, partial [Neisseriaceae bacterium]
MVKIFSEFTQYIDVKAFGESTKKLIQNVQMAVNDGDWNENTVKSFTLELINKFPRIKSFPTELKEFIVILGNLAQHYGSSDGKGWFSSNTTTSVDHLINFIDEQTNDSTANNKGNNPGDTNTKRVLYAKVECDYKQLKDGEILLSEQAQNVSDILMEKNSSDELNRNKLISRRNDELCKLLMSKYPSIE